MGWLIGGGCFVIDFFLALMKKDIGFLMAYCLKGMVVLHTYTFPYFFGALIRKLDLFPVVYPIVFIFGQFFEDSFSLDVFLLKKSE